ncbi:MAG: ABC transporter substrate-binding protein [Chloroflexi bacterium]|nr:ABC transporter substrate-binding protein [Chloroflexota bacterium]
MKKSFLLVATVGLIAFALIASGCGKGATTSTTAAPKTTSSSVQTSTTQASKPATTQTSGSTTAKPTTSPSPTAAAPQYGGTLRLIFGTSPGSLGFPAKSASALDWYTAQPALENLFRWDFEGNIKPMLATEWKIAPDGKSITLTLRKGVKFHDGTDFNAEAAKFNLDLLKENKRSEVDLVTSVDVIDSSTIRLNLSQYNSGLLYDLGRQAGGMISPTAYKANGQQWALKNPVGTGAFKLQSFTPDVEVKYVKNPDYWDKGKPYLDGLVIKIVKDPVTASASFQAGEADILWGSGSLNPRAAYDLVQKGFNVTSLPSNMNTLGPDSKNPKSPFSKLEVRQALDYAIDRAAITKALGYGFWEPLNQLALPTWSWYSPEVKIREFNPAKAKELLAQAGYPTGFKTQITGSVNLANKDAAVALQQQLKQVGIDAEVNLVDHAKYNQMGRTPEGSWEGILFPTPQIPIGGPHAVNLNREIPASYTVYASALRPDTYGAAVNSALGAIDNKEMVKYTQQLNKLIYDNAIVIPLFTTKVFAAKQPAVQDDDHMTALHVRWSPEKTWLKKK